jgi:hypothetical protein
VTFTESQSSPRGTSTEREHILRPMVLSSRPVEEATRTQSAVTNVPTHRTACELTNDTLPDAANNACNPVKRSRNFLEVRVLEARLTSGNQNVLHIRCSGLSTSIRGDVRKVGGPGEEICSRDWLVERERGEGEICAAIFMSMAGRAWREPRPSTKEKKTSRSEPRGSALTDGICLVAQISPTS